MEQLTGFHNNFDQFNQFDREQSWKRISLRRRSKGIKRIQIPETQEWMFSTDLDEEIDMLTRKLEATPCH